MRNAPERGLARERLRRRRDALLLELGALVYELHRRGRRAPELLQAKAAELAGLGAKDRATDVDQNDYRERKEDPGASRCPACGEPVAADQLVCLNCGGRIALGAQPAGAIPVLAAVIALVVIGAGAFGFALSEITSGSDDQPVERAGRQSESPAPADRGEAQAPAETERPTETEAAEPAAETAPGSAQEPAQSLLLEWPKGLTAHTVVLVTTSDRPAARRVAFEAARSGIEAGLLRADDYDLGSGLWIVFAGRFDTRRGAVSQAANLGGRYPGAYPQLLRPVG